LFPKRIESVLISDWNLGGFFSNFRMGSSPPVIKGLAVSGSGPKGSLNIKTSWILSNWNRFEFRCDSNYSHQLDGTSNFPYLASLPKSNSLKLKIRNFIPSLASLQLLDSSVYYEIQNPPTR